MKISFVTKYLESRAKPLASFSYLDIEQLLESDSGVEIKEASFDRIRDASRTSELTRVLQRVLYLIEIDHQLLIAARKENLLSLISYAEIYLIRGLYVVVDILKLLASLMLANNLHLYTDQNYENKQDKYLATFGLNNQRLNSVKTLVQSDLWNFQITRKRKKEGYLLAFCRIGIKEKLEILRYKLDKPQVPTKYISQYVGIKTLIKNFSRQSYFSHFSCFVNREEGSVAVKSIISTLQKRSIPCVVFYSGNISHGYQFVTADYVVTPSPIGRKMFSPKENGEIFRYLSQYPFIDYIETARQPFENVIGYVPMLGNSSRAKELDQELLVRLAKSMPETMFLLRPHPQERTIPHRAAYYRQLSSLAQNIELDLTDEVDQLIRKSYCVICTYLSQIVEQLVISGRTVLFLSIEENSQSEKILRMFGSGLIKYAHPDDIDASLLQSICSHSSDSMRNNWQSTIEMLGYEEDHANPVYLESLGMEI